MLEDSIELGAAVKVDYQLAGTLFSRLDFDRSPQLFTEAVLQSPDVGIDRYRLRFLASRLRRQGLFHQHFGLTHRQATVHYQFRDFDLIMSNQGQQRTGMPHVK